MSMLLDKILICLPISITLPPPTRIIRLGLTFLISLTPFNVSSILGLLEKLENL